MKTTLKCFGLIAMAVLSLPVMTAVAAPLPSGTKLGITPGTGSALNQPCSSGSCFGMEIFAGFIVWADFGPGTDGGIVVGKAQASGGQELAPSPANTSSGELSNAWLYVGNYGTFSTLPGGDTNIFDDASCAGASCVGKTELRVWDVAWNGSITRLGNQEGVLSWVIDPTGNSYSLDYKAISPCWDCGVFYMHLRGVVTSCGTACGSNVAPVAANVNGDSNSGPLITFLFTGTVADVDPVLQGTFAPTQLITGSYTFDATTPATYPNPLNPNTVDYHALLNADLKVGNYSAAYVPSIYSTLSVQNDNYPNEDGYEALIVVDGASVAGIPPDFFTISYYDPTGNALSSLALPLTPSQLAGFPSHGQFDLTFTDRTDPLTEFAHPVTGEITSLSRMTLTWRPSVSDPNGDPLTCRIGKSAANGTASVVSDCSLGTYQAAPGFIGTDTFTYIANDGQYDSNPATVTVAVTEPEPGSECTSQYPVTQFTQTGKQGTLSITFTGNITAHTHKAVNVCPGTPLKYQASSTKGPVVCQVKNNTTRGSGSLRINDHLKCTDKPLGKDKVYFKVKSGVK